MSRTIFAVLAACFSAISAFSFQPIHIGQVRAGSGIKTASHYHLAGLHPAACGEFRRVAPVNSLRCKLSAEAGNPGEWLDRGYLVAAVSWSAACALRLISTLSLPVIPAEQILNALACTVYPVFLLAINALMKAAAKSLENGGKGKGTLASDTYKRLNLAIFGSCALAALLMAAAWPAGAGPLVLAAQALGVAANAAAAAVGLGAWRFSRTLPADGAAPAAPNAPRAGAVAELRAGAAATAGLLARPGKNGLASLYRVATAAVLAEAAAAVVAPGAVMAGLGILGGEEGVRVWGAAQGLTAAALLVLADAADRGRLGGSTFKDLNAGIAVAAVLQGIVAASLDTPARLACLLAVVSRAAVAAIAAAGYARA